MKNKPRQVTPDSEGEAYERALRFLDYRPRTAAEMASRLKAWGYSPRVIEAVLANLKQSSLVDDKRFARLFMDELIKKGFGARRVREKLFEKRLPREVIEEVMLEYPYEDDRERAEAAAVRRSGRASGADEQKAYRQMKDYLMRLGYDGGTAADVARIALSGSVDTENGR